MALDQLLEETFLVFVEGPVCSGHIGLLILQSFCFWRLIVKIGRDSCAALANFIPHRTSRITNTDHGGKNVTGRRGAGAAGRGPTTTRPVAQPAPRCTALHSLLQAATTTWRAAVPSRSRPTRSSSRGRWRTGRGADTTTPPQLRLSSTRNSRQR